MLFSFLTRLIAHGQPVLNERYIIDETSNSNFTSVISTDSCYYVGAIQASIPGLKNLNSSFIRFDHTGEIDSLRVFSNDSLGIGFWSTSEIIQTLDGNFSCLALTASETGVDAFMFIKFNHFGDIICERYLPSFFH